MTVPSRLSVVTLGVQDVAAMRAFFQRLGWTTTSEADDFAAFPLGGAVLCLFDEAKLAAEAGADVPAQQDYRGFSLAINVDERDQVDAVIAAAIEVGATAGPAPTDRDWGGRSGYFADPEGNRWEVAWFPGIEFDDRGALIWPF